MIQQAKRMNGIPFSGIRRIMEMATRLEANGKHSFNGDGPTTSNAKHVKEMAKKGAGRIEGLLYPNYGTIIYGGPLRETDQRPHLQRPERDHRTAGVSEGVFDSLQFLTTRRDSHTKPHLAELPIGNQNGRRGSGELPYSAWESFSNRH